VVDNFAGGVTSSIFSPTSKVSGFMGGVGSMASNMGSGLVNAIFGDGEDGKGDGGLNPVTADKGMFSGIFGDGGLNPVTADKGMFSGIFGDGEAGKCDSKCDGGLNPVTADKGMFSGITDSLTETFSGLFGSDGSISKMMGGFGDGFMEIFSSLGGLGGMIGLAEGGVAGKIRGPGSATSDSIPAMLSNGEFVVNAKSAEKNEALLHLINSGRPVSHLANGGQVSVNKTSIKVASPTDTVKSKGQVVNINITGDISRQTRSEIYKMLPTITQGVNLHNKEKGYRG